MEHPIPPQLHLPQRTDPEAGCMCHMGARQCCGWMTAGLHTPSQAQTPYHKKSWKRDFPRAETDRDSRITLHEFRLQRC